MIMKKFLGILGSVLLAFGIIGLWMLQWQAAAFENPFIIGHFALGLSFLLVWFFSVGLSSLSSAGDVVTGSTARFSANLIVYFTVIAGLLVAANWYANRYNKRWDLTEEGVYSLAPQTKDIISGLKAPLKIIAFKGLTEGGEELQLKDRLELFKSSNPSQVSTEMVDPRAKPHLIDTYEMKQGDKIYISYGQGDTKAVSRLTETSEDAITNSVLKLTRGAAKKIYFVQGHNEPLIDDTKPQGIKTLIQSLKDEQINAEGIVLSKSPAIPTDAAAIVLISPKKNLLQQEKELLIKYAQDGGRLILLGDPTTTIDVSEIADIFGITVRNDVVLDQVQRMFAGPAIGAQPIVTTYDKTSPITKNFTEQNITIFNIGSSVTKSDKADSAAKYIELAKSGPAAWGESDLEALFSPENPAAEKSEKDTTGPLTLAMSYEKEINTDSKPAENIEKFKKISRVVVFGDADWILNANLNVYANRDLFLNSINWLVGEEGGVSIRAGSIKKSSAPIPKASYFAILAWSFLIPELVLIAGLFNWWRRKSLSMA